MRALLMTSLGCLFFLSSCVHAQEQSVELTTQPPVISNPAAYNGLTDFESYVILQKGTERPWTGKYNGNKKKGTYLCKQCNLPLFRSVDKFNSGTGWPSFDDTIEDGVKELRDADGRRTEIVCNNCGGHLGHVFKGEGFTDKQTRHCVNSISLNFVPRS